MKWLIIPIFAFFTGTLEAQHLPAGEYSTRQPIGSITFILKDSARQFYWVADNCSTGITGMGTWEQKRDKLIFVFWPIHQPAVIYRQSITEKTIQDDGIFSAAIQLMDAEDTTVKPAGVYILQRGTKNGAISDSAGQARLPITGTQATLIISGPGLGTDTIYLKERGNWDIKVYLKPANPVFIREGRSEYRIVAKNKEYAELQYNGERADQQTDRFYYRKQTNKQTEAYIRHWLLTNR